MNQREPTAAPFGAGQALPCLALLLLPLLAVARAWAKPTMLPLPALTQATPYLVALGSPPLRFEQPAPPPDLATRPPASAPPRLSADDAVTPAETKPEDDVSLLVVPSTPTLPAATDRAEISVTEASAPVRSPSPILPDEARPPTRPEDFLPFFQIPSVNGDATVIVPVPRTPAGSSPLPTSSAIYTQTPR